MYVLCQYVLLVAKKSRIVNGFIVLDEKLIINVQLINQYYDETEY